jgi:ABC-type antimicrobial peptide transport system permease subunit
LVSVINILGLTFGLASAVLAILYAVNELSYEKCHKNADRICMVYLNGKIGTLNWIPVTCGPEGKALKDMFPEVDKFSIQRTTEGIVKSGENVFKEENILFTDSSAYSILTIPFVKGKPQFDPQSIALSEKTASKYFGKNNPIGKIITINCFGVKMVFTVTGVFRNFSSNTEIKGDLLAPFTVADRYGWKYLEYESTDYQTLILLKPGADVKKLNSKIAANYKIPIPLPDIKAVLMPLKEIHMHGSYENNYGKLLAFLIGGFFVLLTSCCNYVNLTNIVYSTRTREIGIRKVNGATKRNIFIQFICDNALATLIAFDLALVLLNFALPWFNNLMDTHLSIELSGDFLLIGFVLFVLTTIISGVFPAFKYAALKPVSLFQTTPDAMTGKNKSLWMLTTLQFLLAVLFIQVMLIMNKQSGYLTDVNVLGYNSENVIVLPGNEWGDLEKVKMELLKSPAITCVSWGQNAPEMSVSMTENWKDKKNTEPALHSKMEEDYLKVFGIKMAEGRFFSNDFKSDPDEAIVINKKTAFALGYSDPVGRKMMAGDKQRTIIGVIDRYQVVPPIFSDMPLLITLSQHSDNNLIIKVDPKNRKKAHEYITALLRKINPDYPVVIKYHQDLLIEGAKSYFATGKLTQLFFFLTIITSLIGLFALSVFIAEKHRKEVCIRKICGASLASILPRLLRGILYQVLIAICLATPIAIMFSQKYLAIFSNHIHVGPGLFVEGGLIAILITMITVSWQAWRAANRNPVEALRYE